MHSVREVIVVEGRYDKNALSQVVDAVIIETSGFGIFNDAEKRKLLQTMAEARGLIVLTDSDGAGFVIRNYIKGCVDPKLVSMRTSRISTARSAAKACLRARESSESRG